MNAWVSIADWWFFKFELFIRIWKKTYFELFYYIRNYKVKYQETSLNEKLLQHI